jgi:tetratricopeptide (TPR) repeat protein
LDATKTELIELRILEKARRDLLFTLLGATVGGLATIYAVVTFIVTNRFDQYVRSPSFEAQLSSVMREPATRLRFHADAQALHFREYKRAPSVGQEYLRMISQIISENEKLPDPAIKAVAASLYSSYAARLCEFGPKENKEFRQKLPSCAEELQMVSGKPDKQEDPTVTDFYITQLIEKSRVLREEAVRDFERSRKLGRHVNSIEEASVRTSLAIRSYYHEDYDEAVKQFDHSIKLHPDNSALYAWNANALRWKAGELQGNGKTEEARTLLRRANDQNELALEKARLLIGRDYLDDPFAQDVLYNMSIGYAWLYGYGRENKTLTELKTTLEKLKSAEYLMSFCSDLKELKKTSAWTQIRLWIQSNVHRINPFYLQTHKGSAQWKEC